MIRQPAVAGSFYQADPIRLKHDLDQLLSSKIPPQKVKALIVPHAGYIYSGAVAGELFAGTQIPQTVVLLGPNHHGAGHDIAVTGADGWEMPFGTVPIAADLRDKLCAAVQGLVIDDRAHQLEHSLEVMLPFLQCRQPHLSIVPISLRSLRYEDAAQLGKSIAAVLQRQKQEVLLLASSDMNHFLDADTTQKLDSLAINEMTGYDPEGLYKTVMENRISMCGVLPAVVVMHAAKDLGAASCRLVRYAHSGMVNGDNNRVVGYAGLMID
ncbi:AmmeMemoRadiSam system protein B [Malonomonas rubra]|uniref:AmmeMemoRadiSam system protein B n=1 Tax=Malonomonas rubra TaxID=57040 RepID=UPI0026F0AF47|nr:AmmeMemoRadiSam system protein B [Malonomonas rubra]